MKNKDLNTYINDKLEEGNGLPFKEEYWAGMNELLDANMVTHSTATATKATTIKALSGGLKLLYLSSICATIFSVSFMYTRFFNQATPSTAEEHALTTIEEMIAPQTSTVPSTEYETSSEQPTFSNNENTAVGSTAQSLTPIDEVAVEHSNAQKSVSTPFHTNNVTTPNIHSSTPTETPNQKTATTTTASELFDTLTPSSSSFEETVSNRTIDFIAIAPLEHSATLNKLTGVSQKEIPLIAYPKRYRLIQHIAISPFAAVMHEYDKQMYNAPHADYTHPVQTHFSYGVNVECVTKKFALRTGIGWSQTSMRTSVKTTRDFYDVDTTFVVINSNYDTTASGKPVALVQRRIDSSYASSQHSSLQETTTYQYLTIPLTLQYRIAYKRLTVVLEGGTLHHFLIAQKTQTPIQQDRSENGFPVQGYNLQLTAGSGLRYALSSKWAVGIQYNYNLNPSSANLHFLNNAHVATFMLTRTLR